MFHEILLFLFPNIIDHYSIKLPIFIEQKTQKYITTDKWKEQDLENGQYFTHNG